MVGDGSVVMGLTDVAWGQLIDAQGIGCLLEDANRRIVRANPAFCELFSVPGSPDSLVGHDCSRAADEHKQLFEDPENFVARVDELLAAREPHRGEILRLVDGRVLERDYLPVFLDGDYKGHWWAYRDVSASFRVMEERERHANINEILVNLHEGYLGGQKADEPQLYQKLLESVLEVTGSEYGLIGEVRYRNGGKPYLKVRALSNIGWDEETRPLYADIANMEGGGLDFDNLDTLFGYVIRSKKVLVANDVPNDPRRGGVLPEGHPPLLSFLGLPFLSAGKIVGMCGIANRRGGYPQDLVDALAPFSSTMATFVEGVRVEHKRKLAEASAHEARMHAEEAAQAKADFLSLMSHEIRTPLHGVLGLVHLLATDSPAEHQQENLEALQFSAETLMSLINDILDYSKIEAGKLTLDYSVIDVHDMLAGVVAIHKSRAVERGIALNLELGALPGGLRTDKARLIQVLGNLLSNAIKFTKQGSVTVRVFVPEGTTHRILIEVEDTGIGIPEDRQAHVFDAFTQASATTARQYGGTGLGLAICARLVQMLGGELKVRSTVGVGSCFTCDLKADFSAPVLEVHRRLPTTRTNMTGVRVLLVDDVPLNLKVGGRILQRWGIEVDTAESGKEALEKVKSSVYEVILLDIHMPGMDGFETFIQMLSMGIQCPVYALSADVMPSTKEHVKALGMSGLIPKPFPPEELYEALTRHVSEAA